MRMTYGAGAERIIRSGRQTVSGSCSRRAGRAPSAYFWRPADGSGSVQRLTPPGTELSPTSVSPDGTQSRGGGIHARERLRHRPLAVEESLNDRAPGGFAGRGLDHQDRHRRIQRQSIARWALAGVPRRTTPASSVSSRSSCSRFRIRARAAGRCQADGGTKPLWGAKRPRAVLSGPEQRTDGGGCHPDVRRRDVKCGEAEPGAEHTVLRWRSRARPHVRRVGGRPAVSDGQGRSGWPRSQPAWSSCSTGSKSCGVSFQLVGSLRTRGRGVFLCDLRGLCVVRRDAVGMAFVFFVVLVSS